MSAHPIREHRALGTTPRRASLRLAPVANLVRLALVGMALATAASAAAQSTTAPVYRCVEPGGRVLYADYPCKGGARVDIRPGVPAPDATERLARARDELDRAAARRQAIDDAAALQRQALNQRQQELDAQRYADAGYVPDTSYLPAYGFYLPYAGAHRPRAHPPVRPAQHRPAGRVPAVIRPR
jgi:hypothetical protein